MNALVVLTPATLGQIVLTRRDRLSAHAKKVTRGMEYTVMVRKSFFFLLKFYHFYSASYVAIYLAKSRECTGSTLNNIQYQSWRLKQHR